jgi:hypothetical protein
MNRIDSVRKVRKDWQNSKRIDSAKPNQKNLEKNQKFQTQTRSADFIELFESNSKTHKFESSNVGFFDF